MQKTKTTYLTRAEKKQVRNMIAYENGQAQNDETRNTYKLKLQRNKYI